MIVKSWPKNSDGNYVWPGCPSDVVVAVLPIPHMGYLPFVWNRTENINVKFTQAFDSLTTAQRMAVVAYARRFKARQKPKEQAQ